MVKITKVYTRQGDQGVTQLAAGRAVAKNSTRIEAIGCVDELNANMGWLCEVVDREDLLKQCRRIQNELFNLGAQLSVLHEDRRLDTPVITAEDIKRLEQELDVVNDQLPMLTSFILPGGGELACRLHMARTVCRRAERALVTLNQDTMLDDAELPYVNRLSDWLFVMARWVSVGEEVLWGS